MGMLDSSTKFSAAQSVSATGDTASTNIYDNGSANTTDLGLTGALWVNVSVSKTATSAGSATLTPVLQDSADGSTWADVIVGKTYPVASLIVGTPLMQVQPPIGTRQYVRIAYRVATATLTAGKFDAYISMDVQSNVARPSGFTVA